MVPVGLETDFWNVALAATAEALAPEVTTLLYLLKLFPGLLWDEAGSKSAESLSIGDLGKHRSATTARGPRIIIGISQKRPGRAHFGLFWPASAPPGPLGLHSSRKV